jgi:hypothetical protein
VKSPQALRVCAPACRGNPQRACRGASSIESMIHHQLFNALVELALQIVSLVLQFSGKDITPSR